MRAGGGGANLAEIPDVPSAVHRGVSVQALPIHAALRHSDAVILMCDAACVEDDDQERSAARIAAQKGDDRVLPVGAIDPFETGRFGIAPVECGRLSIEAVE